MEKSREINADYKRALEALASGNLELASKLSAPFRESFDPDEKLLHSLVNRRLQYKTGNFEFTELLEPPRSERLRSEYFFVLGLGCFHQSKWLEGAEHFSNAEKSYRSVELLERALLCRFNALIGQINSADYENEKMIPKLQALAVEAQEADAQKMVSLAYRQLAYEFASLKRFHAAAKYAGLSVDAGILVGSKSDRDLSLLVHAISLKKTGEPNKAMASLEEVIEPVEPRVQWPLAVARFLLGMSEDAPMKESYSFVDPFFESLLPEYQKTSVTSSPSSIELIWKVDKGEFLTPVGERVFKMRTSSLEYKLLSLLRLRPQTRNFLIECLYEDSDDQGLVNNRLHRLVSRLNRRYPDLVKFKAGKYSVSEKIEPQ